MLPCTNERRRSEDASRVSVHERRKECSFHLTRIQEAGAPPRFTHEFLKASLGFTSSNDRGIIAVLKHLGFLSADGTPQERYNEFRGGGQGKRALTEGLREGWSELFLADQHAHEKSSSQLTELFKSVTGKSQSVAQKMAATFKALADSADWSHTKPSGATTEEVSDDTILQQPIAEKGAPKEAPPSTAGISLHHDVHVHLPATSDVAVYRAIFRALREELM